MSKTPEDRGGSIAYVLVLTLVAALGGLLFGYDTGVIAGAIGFLKARFDLNAAQEGFSAACALAGCAVGAGMAGFLSDRFGRKKVLLLAALAFFVSALGTALPRNLAEFVAFRCLGGIGIGAASIISPMYIAEVTPFRIRGRMVSLNQFAIVLGMLLVYFVNYCVTSHGIAQDERLVAAHVAEHGARLDPSGVEQYLSERIKTMVAQQTERFLIEPRQTLDRQAVADFLAKQGATIDTKDVASDDRPLSPAFVRDFLKPELSKTNRRRIDEFLASPKALESKAVAEFLSKEADIHVEPIEVSLAVYRLTSWNVERGWRWMFGSGVLPAVVFLLLLLAVPESPRWLTKQGRRDEALAILTRVDGADYARDELRGIDEALATETGRLRDLAEPWLRRVVLLGIALAVLQQVTGINVFLYFAPKVLQSMGAGAGTAMLQTVIVGAVNMAFTILAVAVVDRLGRRPLMIMGSAGMGVALVALGLAAYWQLFQWWALLFILGYIACFAMSVGPVVWVILSEIFPTKIRGRAMGIATVCLWLANYVISQTYPMMAEDPWLLARFHQGFPFFVYAAFCVVLLVVVLRWVPETKGKSLEEIERYWLQKRN
jgi:MFS family permease